MVAFTSDYSQKSDLDFLHRKSKCSNAPASLICSTETVPSTNAKLLYLFTFRLLAGKDVRSYSDLRPSVSHRE